MKKTNIFTLILMMIALALGGGARAQNQFCIGGKNNEMGTNVRVLPDGTGTIIAGYNYDPVRPGATDVSNAQMILMKVDPTGANILWQVQFGIPGTNANPLNNITQNMIITHDGNIVVVGLLGRTNVFAGNIGGIFKFNSGTGALMWQNSFQANPTTIGGERFDCVTELGEATHHELVVGGASNFMPGGAQAMVCVYQANGTFVYEETWPIEQWWPGYGWGSTGGDEFTGVCTAADGKSVYFVGNYRGTDAGSYKDVRVHHYTPGTISGVMNWNQYFDFTAVGFIYGPNGQITADSLKLNDDFMINIYLSGSKLILSGAAVPGWGTGGPSYTGACESVARLNAADGSNIEIWQLQNGMFMPNYSNYAKVTVVNSDQLYNVQMPNGTNVDPVLMNPAGAASNITVTDVTSLTSEYTGAPGGTGPAPLEFTTPSNAGIHAALDITQNGTNLYMAGATTDPLGFGNNDIYFVVTPASLPVDKSKKACDVADIAPMQPITAFTVVPTMNYYQIANTTVSVTPVATTYTITPVCKTKPPYNCDSTWNMNCTNLTATQDTLNGPCNYILSVHGKTFAGWNIIGYSWTPPGPAWTTVPVSVPVTVSGTQIISVTIYAVDPYNDTCTLTLSDTLSCNPPCVDTCTHLVITPLPPQANSDSCYFSAVINTCTSNTVVGYMWTISYSTGGGVTFRDATSSLTDGHTFAVPPGATATVSVTVFLVDYNFQCCQATYTQQVSCQQNPGCFNLPQTTLTATSITDLAGNCDFTCTATATTNPGWTVVGYVWTRVATTFPFTTSNTFLDVLPNNTSTVINVVIYAVDAAGDTCTDTLYIILNCENGVGSENKPAIGNGGGNDMSPQAGEISIYPNPTNDAVTVTSSQPSISNIQVIDVNGTKLGDYTYNNSSQVSVSLTNFPPGTYLLRVNNSTSKVVTKIK